MTDKSSMTFEDFPDLSVFDSGPVCIFRWSGLQDENGWHPVLFVTANVEALTGYTQEEMMDRGIEYGELIAEEDIAAVLEKIREHEATGGKAAFTDQYRIRHRNGDIRWVSDHTQMIYNPDGSLKEMVGYIGDITEMIEERIRAEEAVIAKKSAEEADRTKSQFLANMSHEIRTPMNGVLGMAQLLSNTELTTKQKNFADIIVKSGESLLTIINDILDFSKIGAGEMELHAKPFNLIDAVEDVAMLLSAQAAEKDIELIVRCDKALPSVFVGDAGRLRQIVTNFVTNAVKFTKTGHVLLDVSRSDWTSVTDEDIALQIRVEDTGVGIPEDKLESVFQKFTQVDNSATRAHEGTGLGLSICKSLVELMGGEIGVESVEGEGTTFWFNIVLPAHPDSVQAPVAPIDVNGARVLIIDDNEVNRTILIEQCTAWGFNAKAAKGGKQGIMALKLAELLGEAFELVILDYQMPGLNGEQTLKFIRSEDDIGQTPVVMLTSVDQTLGDSKVNGHGIQGHLTKPAKGSVLLETLIEVVQKSRAHGIDEPEQIIPVNTNTNGNGPDANGARDENAYGKLSAQKQSGNPDILIAEDNSINRIVYEQLLKGQPFSLQIVDDGRQAIDAWKTLRPSLIIMDVSMPVLDGISATTEIRAFEQENNLPATPIIGVTAHAMSGDMEKCLDAGMDDYLPKPISQKRLFEKIRNWTETSAAKRATG